MKVNEKIKYFIASFIICLGVVAIPVRMFAADDNIRTYPDGSYGMDLGGGYEVAPIGPDGKEEILMPERYRQDYEDSQFGPMMKKGFLMFPNFQFSGAAKKKDFGSEKKKEDRELKEQIFHQSTTSLGGSSWGVYIPPKDGSKSE